MHSRNRELCKVDMQHILELVAFLHVKQRELDALGTSFSNKWEIEPLQFSKEITLLLCKSRHNLLNEWTENSRLTQDPKSSETCYLLAVFLCFYYFYYCV